MGLLDPQVRALPNGGRAWSGVAGTRKPGGYREEGAAGCGNRGSDMEIPAEGGGCGDRV